MESSLSHIAFLVPSAESSAAFLKSQGISTEPPEVFDSEGTKEIYVGSYEKQRGLLLLVEAISEGPYKRALAKRGPSLHHIAIDVLDVMASVAQAESLGWQQHAINAQTLPQQKTAWLYLKGIPCLIEMHQKKELSNKALKITNLTLPIKADELKLFEGLGLGGLVTPNSAEIQLTLDGHQFLFSRLIS